MISKTLVLATALTACWATEDTVAQDNVLTELHRLGRSLMNVAGTTLEPYASPTLPCNGEGFYSYTSDCTKFYRCIDLFGKNDYLRLAFKCQAGTIFSQEYKSCIPGNCSPGLASAAAAAATVSATRDDVVVVPSIRNQDIHSSSTSNEYGSQQCSSEGRFADPDNCGNYFDCVPSHNGGFVAHQQSCFGNAFHPGIKSCVPKQMVKGCVPYSIRSFTVADPKLEHFCHNAENEFICADCKTLVICIDGKPYTEPCEYGSVCSLKRSFRGGVCYPGEPAECTCNKADILKRDFYNPSKFLSCGIEGTDPIIHTCPEGSVYNEQRRSCGTETESTCTLSGTFAVKEDCTRYYTCIFTTGGWVQKEFTCRNNTMFNEETGKCEDPCDWYTGHFTCETEGRYANPSDCTKYYECIADPLNPNRFSWVEHECPEGYEWNQMAKRGVGHCVDSGTVKEKCVPQKPNTCNIPTEWCTSESVSCNSQIIRGRSYFISPNFPEPIYPRSPDTCEVELLPPENIIQIRLDFEEFSIHPPIEGDCSNDTFFVTGANSGSDIPVICGENSGQHMYIEVDNTDAPIKLIVTESPSFFARIWKIRVTFIHENDPLQAPNHCLQYHKENAGKLMSFNYGYYESLNNLEYSICFGYIPGYCDIGLKFYQLDLGNINGVCTNDYLGNGPEKICGDYMDYSLLANSTGPISLLVVTDDYNGNREEGFSGTYTMLGC